MTDTITISEAEYLEITKAYEAFEETRTVLKPWQLQPNFYTHYLSKSKEVMDLIGVINKLRDVEYECSGWEISWTNYHTLDNALSRFTPEILNIINSHE